MAVSNVILLSEGKENIVNATRIFLLALYVQIMETDKTVSGHVQIYALQRRG